MNIIESKIHNKTQYYIIYYGVILNLKMDFHHHQEDLDICLVKMYYKNFYKEIN